MKMSLENSDLGFNMQIMRQVIELIKLDTLHLCCKTSNADGFIKSLN